MRTVLAAAVLVLALLLAGPSSAAPPVLVVPADFTVEATGPEGAPVAFQATATNQGGKPLTVVCEPASGTTFPLGATTVTCVIPASDGSEGRSASFAVTVADTTPPVLTIPADLGLGGVPAGGLPASDPRIAAFLAGAVATDIVTAAPAVVTDAPGTFPLGRTAVVFTATDAAGNTASATAAVTLASGAAPPPPPPAPGQPPAPPGAPAPAPQPDRVPPANVSAVRASAGSASVSLAWRAPADPDFSHVEILRNVAAAPAASAVVVYRGTAATFRDTRLRNGTQYRYVVVSYDRSGNRSAGVAVVAMPRAPLLRTPADGASVVRAPLLTWARVSAATYYNVQLYRGSTKVLSAWPVATRLQLATQWQFAGAKRTLAPGTYRWYVWPGLGKRSDARYGAPLGTSTFVVRAR